MLSKLDFHLERMTLRFESAFDSPLNRIESMTQELLSAATGTQEGSMLTCPNQSQKIIRIVIDLEREIKTFTDHRIQSTFSPLTHILECQCFEELDSSSTIPVLKRVLNGKDGIMDRKGICKEITPIHVVGLTWIEDGMTHHYQRKQYLSHEISEKIRNSNWEGDWICGTPKQWIGKTKSRREEGLSLVWIENMNGIEMQATNRYAGQRINPRAVNQDPGIYSVSLGRVFIQNLRKVFLIERTDSIPDRKGILIVNGIKIESN